MMSRKFDTFAKCGQKNFARLDRAPFGSKVFKDITGKRRLLQATTLLKQDCAVLQVDVDTVWKADVFADIDAMGPHQLILTDDYTSPIGTDVTKAKNWYLCTCFM